MARVTGEFLFAKTRTVIVTKRAPIYREGVISSGFVRIERIPPLAASFVTELQIWFGLDEAPADGSQLQVYLLAADVDNLPDIAGVRERHLWAAVQKWHAVGTPASIVMTISHENLPFFSPTGYLTHDLATRIRANFWIFVVTDTTHAQMYLGAASVRHELTVRTWGSDAYTWNNDPGSHNSEGISEIDMFG